MAIIGDGFIDYVKKQIDTRQKALGEYDNRQLKNTMAFMTRTPWVRMVSSVNMTEGDLALPGDAVLDTLLKSGNYTGIDLSGDNLAKNFILFNGISNEKGGITNLYSGITGGPLSQTFGGAYGFGSKDDIQNERGFVPMPGITNVNFQYKNDGALATAQVQIKAFSRSQFQLIDILFQRPGYTVLLEFGSTVYLDNNGNLKEADYSTAPFTTMFETNQDMFTLHKVIAEEKQKWNGNYEGFFAKIAKWNWKFNSDGSYDITVNLIGMGDVIDSLKINIASRKTLSTATNEETNQAKKDNIVLIAEAKASEFNANLFTIYNIAKNSTSRGVSTPSTSLGVSPTTGIPVFSPSIYSSTQYFVSLPIDNFPTPVKNKDGMVEKFEYKTQIIKNGAFKVTNTRNNTSKKYDPQVWITFGTLLALITVSLNIKDKNKKIPLVNFDFDFNDLDNDKNYMATFPGNFSSNPNVCIIPYSPVLSDIIKPNPLPQTNLNTFIQGGAKFNKDNNLLVGRIANVYLEINFIAETFKRSINDKKEVILIDFLKNILNEMNNTLGGLNEFRVIHNKDTNLFEILVETPLNLQLNVDLNSERHTINTFGVTRGEGSFVREMDLNSELTDKYATMITIGAQANGNVPQANSTAFSIYNKGLVDRVIKEKVNINNNSTTEISEDPFLNLFTPDVIQCFKNIYNKFQFIDENTSVLQNINSEFCNLATGKLTQQRKYPSPFFLPFNLSLTMDGLSGMKIYQSFKVDGKALPLTYNANVIQLIIKSLSHDISPNGWLTKVETIAGPIFDIDPNITPGKYEESTTPETTNSPSSNTPSSTTPPPPALDPTSASRFLAMQKSYNAVYRDQFQEDSMCGRWIYNLAYNYVRALRGDNKIAGKQITGKGHAREESLRSNLSKLGYTVTKVGNNIPKQQLKFLISSTTWGYGDIAIYYANDGAGSHRTYGHTQIYIGNISGVPSDFSNKRDSGWATSNSNNYGSPFVYGDRNSNKWDFYVLRAPSK
jgi:hypothetical protein